MTLEERIAVLHRQGKLVHLSLAFYDGEYHCNLALTEAQGYHRSSDKDPLVALEAALKGSGVRQRAAPVTAAVKETPEGMDDPLDILPAAWTTP